ncbi:MAG TPA: glycosyltransferase family 4 protein [Gemmatimonadales bacterium]|nr:glycosyltransferase family 4 protein [Gemmatimonadales bacterium]
MRIAMISTPFVPTPPRDYGGTELVVAELTEGLVARGHDVTLFATGDSHTSAELRFFYAQAQWPPDPFVDLNHVSWALRQVMADEGYDIVHLHSACGVALARLRPELGVVYTLHHAYEPRLSSFYAHLQHDVQFVTISADQRRHEPELGHCPVVHHGLDPAWCDWTAHPQDYVCFVGRFAREKGAHVAIDVAAAAGVPIRVAGRIHPPDRAYAAEELGHRLDQSHVRYLGAVGRAAKKPLLCYARALLAPIAWDEPFGMVLIEAMLSSCPVVGFPRGSVPELVTPGVTGLIVQSADEMAAAIAPGGPVDQIDRRLCRQVAVEHFSRDRMVSEYERVYAEVLTMPDGVEPTSIALP